MKRVNSPSSVSVPSVPGTVLALNPHSRLGRREHPLALERGAETQRGEVPGLVGGEAGT